MSYEGKARKSSSGVPPVAEGMRRVEVGKVGINNDDVDQIDRYLDEDGAFQGKIVHETARNRFVDYPMENYVAHMKQAEDDARLRLVRSPRAGIPGETDQSKIIASKPVALSQLVAEQAAVSAE